MSDRYFPVSCPECAWEGLSNEVEGGTAIADTGDYDNLYCPECVKREKWVIVEEM